MGNRRRSPLGDSGSCTRPQGRCADVESPLFGSHHLDPMVSELHSWTPDHPVPWRQGTCARPAFPGRRALGASAGVCRLAFCLPSPSLLKCTTPCFYFCLLSAGRLFQTRAAPEIPALPEAAPTPGSRRAAMKFRQQLGVGGT